MGLKVYGDRLSQPSRAIMIFCKVNGIDFEEVEVAIFKGEHQKPEYKEINPMGLVPAIATDDFTLFESHAILRYLACAYPQVADHWYPADLTKRAKIDSVLDWHHSNLRRGSASLIKSTVAPIMGLPSNPDAIAEAEQVLTASLEKLESFWLKENGKFLLGASEPSIADLSLVCEIMESELLEEKDTKRLLAPYKKVLQWVHNTWTATNPQFEEVHGVLFAVKAQFSKQSGGETQESASTIRAMFPPNKCVQ